MLAKVARGLAAGALGTLVLNVTTYLDVTMGGRPSSQVPAKTAGRMADGSALAWGAKSRPSTVGRGSAPCSDMSRGWGSVSPTACFAPGCPLSPSPSARSPSAHRRWR